MAPTGCQQCPAQPGPRWALLFEPEGGLSSRGALGWLFISASIERSRISDCPPPTLQRGWPHEGPLAYVSHAMPRPACRPLLAGLVEDGASRLGSAQGAFLFARVCLDLAGG